MHELRLLLGSVPTNQQVKVERQESETDEAYQQRLEDEFDGHFIGAAPMSQAVLMNSHPTCSSRSL